MPAHLAGLGRSTITSVDERVAHRHLGFALSSERADHDAVRLARPSIEGSTRMNLAVYACSSTRWVHGALMRDLGFLSASAMLS